MDNPRVQRATSLGVCKYCHKTQEFKNSLDARGFGDKAKVARAKDWRKDDGDFYAGGDRMLGPTSSK